jgi:hypothetical protein
LFLNPKKSNLTLGDKQFKIESMPIEIKELLIRAAVSNGNLQQVNTASSNSDILRLKKQITKEVTESVLKTLKQKSER